MASIFCNGYEFKNIEAVLFDKDGTFVDSNLYWGKLGENRINAIIDYYKMDKNLFYELCEVIGYDSKTGKLIYNGPLAILSRDEVIETLVSHLKKYVNSDFETVDMIFNKVHEEFLKDVYKYTKLINGSVECFERLKIKGIKLAVVTSDSYANTCETLKSLKVDKYFDYVVGKDSCPEPKKTGKPAELVLNKFGVKPENAIVIGDAPMDALMAKNSFMQGSILVQTGQTSLEELTKYATVVCVNLDNVN
ncbi:MAG: HAD family hydrolase [bacterium]|nr:HAD family hydrolase [bacterium]